MCIFAATSEGMQPEKVRKPKYIFVTGGVTSSLGKGILAASLGKLLQERGYRVTIQKFDPYLNVDPGTMSPYEHGECFITEDGAETDLDLGHYERFLGIRTSAKNNVTTGRVYYDLINRERRGDFLGKTVQVIPHVTDEIKSHVYKLGETGEHDIVITEVGGCIGDIESQPFVEAIRQVKLELDAYQTLFLHLTLVPYLQTSGELKTKPTQQSVKELLSLGVQPDILLCRCSHPLPKALRRKIALHCNVPLNHVIEARDAAVIYEVPLLLRKECLDERVLIKLKLPYKQPPELLRWKVFVGNLHTATDEVHIALVGKYVSLHDAYMSIQEALTHAGAYQSCKVVIGWLSAEDMEEPGALQQLSAYDGVLLAPGFGSRGFEGKVEVANYAREQKKPFLGICLGMQCAVVAFARHVLGLRASSSEIEPNTPNAVIDLMLDQKTATNKGGTMRLGNYICRTEKGSKAHQAYGYSQITERHRHRYELNNKYADRLSAAGLRTTGTNPDTGLAEIVELSDHPWYLGCQFHPEYRSTVEQPHALFVRFVQAALTFKKKTHNLKKVTEKQ